MTSSFSSKYSLIALLAIAGAMMFAGDARGAYPYCSPRQSCFRDSDCSQGFCKNRDCQCYPDPGYCANRCLELGLQYASPDACGPGIPGSTVHITPCRGAGARPRYGGGIISYCNRCVPPPPPPTPVPPPTPPSIPPCTAPNGCAFSSATCTVATGTARDADGSPVDVHVYEGAAFRGNGPANPTINVPLPFTTPVGPAKVTHTLSAYALDVKPSGGVAGPAVQIFTDQVAVCLPPVPTLTLNATSPVAYMGTSTISWNVPTASSCTATGGSAGWAGAKLPAGNFVTGPLTGNTTFSMQCTNDGGTGPIASVLVTVGPPLAPVISALSQPDYCTTTNLSATVTWTSQTNNDYQVQAATDAAFANVIYDSKNPLVFAPQHWWQRLLRWLGFADEAEAAGGILTIPSDQLAYNTTYYVRVRVRDNPASAWSPWSANDVSLPEPLTTFSTPESEYPRPLFDWSPDQVFAGVPVQFTDQSTGNPTAWNWNFGDSSPADITQNPGHTYAAEGAYTVTLQVTNDAGSCTSTPAQGMLNAEKPIPGYREVRPGTQPSPSPTQRLPGAR